MNQIILTIMGLFGVCFIWSKYQRIRWTSEADRLCMAKFNELKALDFNALLQHIGQPHKEERHEIRGHQFLVGWRVDEPGGLGTFVNDASPPEPTSKSLAEIDEVEVNGYVDFIYPIPFWRGFHSGFSMNFFKKRNGELRIIFPKTE